MTEHNDDHARFETHKHKVGSHLEVLRDEGWHPRNVAVVIPTPEVVAHGMADFAVLPAEHLSELCRSIGAAMPAPPSPGCLLVAVPFRESPATLALRTFEVPLLTADELAEESALAHDEKLVAVTTDEQRADLHAIELVASSWVDVVTARTPDGEPAFRWRVLRCEAFDVVLRELPGGFIACARRGPTADTIIVKRVHSPDTARKLADEQAALERADSKAAASAN